MQLLCQYTDLVRENNPRMMENQYVEPIEGRIRVLSKASS